MSILTLKNISKTYEGKVPYTALKDINLNVEKGEFIAVMGPSGSGKSTLLNIISTIDVQSKGEVKVNGKDTSSLKGEELAQFRRKELGFVFQNFNLMDTLTIEENIMLPLTLDSKKPSEMKKEAKEVATLLGIDSILNRRTYEISGGQAQRCAVARAIINKPALLLADEPTGNLDSKATDDVLKLFEKINKENNVTTLMVTHEAYSASFAKRVIFIKDGNIYKELVKENKTNEAFYEEILSVLSHIGGGK